MFVVSNKNSKFKEKRRNQSRKKNRKTLRNPVRMNNGIDVKDNKEEQIG